MYPRYSISSAQRSEPRPDPRPDPRPAKTVLRRTSDDPPSSAHTARRQRLTRTVCVRPLHHVSGQDQARHRPLDDCPSHRSRRGFRKSRLPHSPPDTAAMAAPPPIPPPKTGGEISVEDKPSIPSRNPLPLSASQEAQVRDIYYARVRSACADEIKGGL